MPAGQWPATRSPSARSCTEVPMAMITVSASTRSPGSGLVWKAPSASRVASTSAPVWSRSFASRSVRPATGEPAGTDGDLLEAVVEVAVVHHDVEELGDVRLVRERRHPRTAELLRVHDAV